MQKSVTDGEMKRYRAFLLKSRVDRFSSVKENTETDTARNVEVYEHRLSRPIVHIRKGD